MNILIFKTDIGSLQALENVKELLDRAPQIIRWTIDQEDKDNVLRVETFSEAAEDIAGLVKRSGFACEELKD